MQQSGVGAEYKQLNKAFGELKDQMKLIYRKRILYITVEQFLMKYVWSGTGMVMIALPILATEFAYPNSTRKLEDEPDGGVSERTRGFATAKNLLYSSADAVERLMTSYKEITELAGYTSRVHEMFSVFQDVKKRSYSRTLVGGDQKGSNRGGRMDTSKIEGWSASNDWMDVLSGGEKQRMGLARVFYHKKFHTHLLQYDGEGGYKLSCLSDTTIGERLSLSEEKRQIEGKLGEVSHMKERLAELCQMLGEDMESINVDDAADGDA
ncbi:hypothetical protein ANCCEY_13304 [Ancylostoma ceylanicum]|uniref:ABC transmembrane type-1 domain-containing protein n=1 Tax=Ancylostoma ceylanicum TaxID=53326 RepID=A0A0D6L787_9BILA|nr:hypothetical protein ANCCEY_13304 [Ancylostoma ceylanicum]